MRRNRRVRFSEPFLRGRALESAVVRVFTHEAFGTLDAIPPRKYEQAIRDEVRRGGNSNVNQMIDRIVRDEKKAFDAAVKSVRQYYTFIPQTDINQLYHKFMTVIKSGLQTAAQKVSAEN